MMVLVDFLVHGGNHVFMPLREDLLLDNRLTNFLVHGGFVLPIMGHEVCNDLFSFIHCV